MSHDLLAKLSLESDSFALVSYLSSAQAFAESAQRSVSLMCGAIGITLGYGFLTEATPALVITLACLLLGRNQHSAAVDNRVTGDSITPVDRTHRHYEP